MIELSDIIANVKNFINGVFGVLKGENLFINLHNVQIEPIIEKRVFGHTVPDGFIVIEWLHFD